MLSIGIPVYNAGPFLGATLDSLLAQTRDDFELIVVDNASTDDTDDICRDYARRDDRIRHVRNLQNIGSRRNYRLAFELSRGEYFVWARAHDHWREDRLEKCAAILDADDSVVLCHTRCTEFDHDGKEIGSLDEDLDTRGMDLPDRMRATWSRILGPAAHGLIRRDKMVRTRLYRSGAGCDILFLLELSVHGAFAFLDEPLLLLRRHREESSEEETVERTRLQMDPFADDRRQELDTHMLDFCREHLQIIYELHADHHVRQALEADLIDCYAEKFGGSLDRCAVRLAEFVAERYGPGSDRGAFLTHETVKLFDWIHIGLLFRPDNADFEQAHTMLADPGDAP